MNGLFGKRQVKPGGIGDSHEYTLRRLQRQPIGAIDATKLTEDDVIDHCKLRINHVRAPTINQDIGYLHGALKYVKAARKDCREIKASAVHDARPFLVANGYIAKSIPRKRIPTDEEIHALLAEAAKPPRKANKNFAFDCMADIIACGLVSSRRLGEICGLRRSLCDWDHKDADGKPAPMYTVEKMKHPTKRDHSKTFPIMPELAVILKRQPVREGTFVFNGKTVDKADFFFPVRKKSASARYLVLKKRLGITGLRFHDNRRAAITYWLTKMTPHQVRHFISGHESVKMIESNYDATDPALGHALFRQIAEKSAAAA